MRNEEMYGSIIRQVRDSVTQTVEEIASVHEGYRQVSREIRLHHR